MILKYDKGVLCYRGYDFFTVGKIFNCLVIELPVRSETAQMLQGGKNEY